MNKIAASPVVVRYAQLNRNTSRSEPRQRERRRQLQPRSDVALVVLGVAHDHVGVVVLRDLVLARRASARSNGGTNRRAIRGQQTRDEACVRGQGARSVRVNQGADARVRVEHERAMTRAETQLDDEDIAR